MTTHRPAYIGAAVAAAVAATILVLAPPGDSAEESKARVKDAPASKSMCLQGTWSADQNGHAVRGTWQMRFRVSGDFESFEGAKATELRNFSGLTTIEGLGVTSREVYGSIGAERIEFTIPADPKSAGTVRSAEFRGEGKVSGSAVTGVFESNAGVRGTWEGWWVAKRAEIGGDAIKDIGGAR
jgi:hypothetical protein